ncbi:hypothetical protein J6590_056398 [Homalodisca vitripennis]|nr:hypothetical protein J6590_056398 [Homalodisca vitripennis]
MSWKWRYEKNGSGYLRIASDDSSEPCHSVFVRLYQLEVAIQGIENGSSSHATYRRVALPRILLQWEWQLLLIGQTLSSGRGPAPFTKSLTGAPVKASSQLLVRSVRYTHMYFGYR